MGEEKKQPGRPKGGKNSLWSPQEEAKLQHLYEHAGLTVPEICKLIGRSFRSVQGKAVSLGLKSGRIALKGDTREAIIARMQEKVPRLAEEAMEHSIRLFNGGVKLADTAIATGEARDYNHATAGAERMLRTIASAARGLEGASAGKGSQDAKTPQVNMFFFGGKPEKPIETVREVVDV